MKIMKRFMGAVLSALMMFCCFGLTSCKTPEVKYTFVALVNNSTGFTVSDDDVSVAIGVKKGSSLTALFNGYLETLSDQAKNDLMIKMYKVSKGEETFTPSYDPNHDTSSGVLKVAMECGYKPFNWTQNTNANGALPIHGVPGKYANGYDVQIAAMLAAALGFELEIYQAEWGSLVTGVETEVYDAIIAGMSPTAERMEKIDFTTAYYKSNLVIITREGSQIASATKLADLDKDGVKIAAQPGTFHLTALQNQTTKLTVVNSYSDFNAMQMALETGLIDGYVAEEPTAMAFC